MLVTDRFPAIAAMSCMADLKTEKSLPLENLSERPVDALSRCNAFSFVVIFYPNDRKHEVTVNINTWRLALLTRSHSVSFSHDATFHNFPVKIKPKLQY